MMYEIMTPAEAKALGGLTLAFFGDSVYEVYVREQIVKLGTMPVDKLHKKAVQYVNAGFQSYAYDIIAELLTEEETEIFKRGVSATLDDTADTCLKVFFSDIVRHAVELLGQHEFKCRVAVLN